MLNLNAKIQTLISDLIVNVEGATYTDNPLDAGGPTKYGVTQATARAFGYQGDMRDLSIETATQIYAQRYWFGPKFDQIVSFSEPLAILCFNWGVNAGPSVPAQAVQKALNLLNRQGADYPDITADGNIGPMTLSALQTFAAKRGSEGRANLEFMVRSRWSVFYQTLAEQKPSQEAFENGWQTRARIA